MSDYKSKIGPIPPENFENEPGFVPDDELEKISGGMLGRLREKLKVKASDHQREPKKKS